jgi:hypothetical protein
VSNERPEIKWLPAEERHELFFAGIVKLALDLHLRDEEIAALAGKMLGYNRAYTPETSSSMPHLVDVFRKNMREGKRQVESGEVRPKS